MGYYNTLTDGERTAVLVGFLAAAPDAVKFHLQRTFRKLGVPRRTRSVAQLLGRLSGTL